MNLKTLLATFLFLTLSVDSRFVLKRNDNIFYQSLKMSQVVPFHFALDDFRFTKMEIDEIYYYQMFIKFDKNCILFMIEEGNTNPNIIERGDYVLLINKNNKVFYSFASDYENISKSFLK